MKRHLYFDGLLTVDERSLVNEGGLAEQFIAQHLLHPLQAPQLCYWLREGKSSNAEVDYVISQENLIVPIEVKAGKSGALKLLQQFVRFRCGSPSFAKFIRIDY